MLSSKNSLHGEGVLVVGGARGIGAATVRGLVELGAEVAVIDKATDSVEGLDGSERVTLLEADICDENAVAAAYEKVDAALPSLKAVVNTVGVAGGDEASAEMAEESWRALIDVNLTGIFWSCQQAGRRMLERGGGSIVNFSSLCGIQVARTYRTVHYHAAKAGINALTRALAAEWGDRGVRVNSIAPGAFLTGAPAGLFKGDMDRLRNHQARIASYVPLRRLGDPDEMVPTVIYLASDASSYMTGSTLIVDGGRGLEFD